MEDPVIKRVLVWSGWLRISHASIGLAVLLLLLTGWLIAESPSLAESALDLHYLASGFLVFGLVVRIVLMFAGMESSASCRSGSCSIASIPLSIIGSEASTIILFIEQADSEAMIST